MAFLIGGANSLTAGYNIDNSCRWNDDDSPKLSDAIASTSASWTVSAWVKRSDDFTSNNYIISWGTSGTDGTGIGFGSVSSVQNRFFYYSEDDPDNILVSSTGVYRDTNAWYHCVVKCDSGTVTLYINGESVGTGSGGNPLDSSTVRIGCWVGDNLFHDGYISEVYFSDGTAYSASTFGETDEDSGIWKPKNASITYGTHGFRLEFKQSGTGTNSSGIGADTSGNDNHFAVSNLAAIDQTTDTPTNNWCTINVLSRRITSAAPTHAEGNTKITSASANTQTHGVYGSIGGLKSGKWYYEGKPTLVGSDGTMTFGFGSTDARSSDSWGSSTSLYGYTSLGSKKTSHGTTSTTADWGDTYDDDDIISVAIDLDNGAIYFAKNGTWQDSGDPTSGATKTGAAYTDVVSSMPADGYVPANRCIRQTNGDQEVVLFNFGNPAFAISSSQADDNGYGNFEYDVPAGYYAICTKNLAEFG